MKKFFNKLKAKLLYFLWDSRKPFFTVFFAVIIICFMISSVSFIVVYSNTGIFFKECDMNDYSRTFEPKKIEIDFKGNGEIIIRKSESVNIDFDDIFLTDNYYSYGYQINFKDNYEDCFEKKKFEFKDEFIDSLEVLENDRGETVLNIEEKDIFAVETFKNNNNEMVVTFKEPKDVYDNIIVIDPGHGGMDFGVNGIKCMEKDVNLKICKKIENMFSGSDKVKVYLTRNSDDYLKDEKRVFFANQYADLFLSIHLCCESSYDFSDKTRITYIDDDDSDKFKFSGRYCSEILKKSCEKYLEIKKIDIISKDNQENKDLKAFSIFLEFGYNDEFDENKFSDKAAYAVYDGIEKIIG